MISKSLSFWGAETVKVLINLVFIAMYQPFTENIWFFWCSSTQILELNSVSPCLEAKRILKEKEINPLPSQLITLLGKKRSAKAIQGFLSLIRH